MIEIYLSIFYQVTVVEVSSLLDCVHCVLVLLVRWAGACHASPASHDEVMKRARAEGCGWQPRLRARGRIAERDT